MMIQLKKPGALCQGKKGLKVKSNKLYRRVGQDAHVRVPFLIVIVFVKPLDEFTYVLHPHDAAGSAKKHTSDKVFMTREDEDSADFQDPV
jgi:hypothetical protein